MNKRITFFVTGLAALAVLATTTRAQQPRAASGPSASPALRPTNHPRVSREATDLWYVSQQITPRAAELSSAIRLVSDGEYATALPMLTRAAAESTVLSPYATYELGVAQLGLKQADEARRTFQSLQQSRVAGALAEVTAFGEADADEALSDWPAAIVVYERMLKEKVGRPDEVLMRLGNAAKAGGQLERAASAFLRVHYEFALGEFAPDAGAELKTSRNVQPIAPGNERYRLALGRAERLFGAKQYALARAALDELRPHTRGDDRELVDLRIAETNYFLKRARIARDGLKPLIDNTGGRQGEALYFYALALRDLGATTDYLKTIRRVVDDFANQSWAEEALNNLATHFIVKDEDDRADDTFRELYAKYSKSAYAERAAWKVGWRAYSQANYSDTVSFFDRAAADFPRSDYRPSWLYWSGRAHDLLNEPSLAQERFTLVAADYANSYYGRLALKRLDGWKPAPRVIADADLATTVPALPNAAAVRALVSAGLYDLALAELRYAQRTWGDSAAIQATIAWISREQGLLETGTTRFTLVRGSITTMRRAYPQFMAAGGELLPREILTIIFPIEYWDLIRKYSDENALDPYLVTALVAQESTFVPDIRSSANAVGLMQLMAPTARQYARTLGITYTSRLVTNPEASIRIGTRYFADKIKQFGAMHLALASYNAGESPVKQWMSEFGNIGTEEFIDSIPYPETQNYVKRILGTTEDYRRLYGQ